MPLFFRHEQQVEEEQTPTEDIYLTVSEVYGASLAPLMHPCHPHVIAYATGPFIVIWDWKADRKQVCPRVCSYVCGYILTGVLTTFLQLLRQHRLAVTSMCFSKSGFTMVTADVEKVLVWDSASWELLDAAVRPLGRTGEFATDTTKTNLVGNTVENIKDPKRITRMHFLDGERSMVSLEQCDGMKAIQSLRIWQLDERTGLKASAEHSLNQDVVHSLCAQQQNLAIYTCSNGELSAWTCHDKASGSRFGDMQRLWGVHCDEFDGNFVGVSVAPAMCWVILPVSHGKILILDDHGNTLRTVTRENAIITSICMASDECLLVGTSKGTVLYYNVPTLDVWRRMPYDLALRDSIEAAQSASSMALDRSLDPDSTGIRGVRVSALSAFSGLCMRHTADQTIAVLDLSTGNVNNASFGHLNDVLCMCSASSARTQGICIYSGSLDETAGIWELEGAKGVECSQQRFFDVPSNIHPSLTYRRGLSAPFAHNQGHGPLIVGGEKLLSKPAIPGVSANPGVSAVTRQGTSTQADQAEGPRSRATNCISVRSIAVDAMRRILACGTDNGSCMIFDLYTNKLRFAIDLSRSGKKKENVSAVAGLAFVNGGSYLVARSASGWVWLLDSLTGFGKTMVVQEPEGKRDSPSYPWPCHKVLVVEDILLKDEKRREAKSQVQPSHHLAFQVVTFKETGTLGMYLVEAHKYGSTRNLDSSSEFLELKKAKEVAIINVDHSPVDIALHASQLYVYVMSESGNLQIKDFRNKGDAFNVIPSVEADKGYVGSCLALDPSGLYLVTACTARDLSASSLFLWEAATGEMIDCVRHLPSIRCVCFTCDSRGIVAGCHGGQRMIASVRNCERAHALGVHICGRSCLGVGQGGAL